MKIFFLSVALFLIPKISTAATQVYIPSTSTYHNYVINVETGTIRQFTCSTCTMTKAIISSATIGNLNISTANISFPLTVSTLTVTSSFTAINATIVNETVSTSTITRLIVTQSTITTLTSNSHVTNTSTGTTVNFTTGTITTFNTDVATVTTSLSMSNKKIVNLANGTASAHAAAFGQLKIIQVVSFTISSSSSTTATTFVPSDLTASITPGSTSNKVLIFASGPVSQATQNNSTYLSLARGVTNLGGSNGFQQMFTVTGGNTAGNGFIVYLDSPATTSSTSYTVTMRVGGGTGNFGIDANTTKSIVLMEVAP